MKGSVCWSVKKHTGFTLRDGYKVHAARESSTQARQRAVVGGLHGILRIHLLFSASQKKLWQDCLEVILEKLERLVPLHSSPTPPTRFSRMCPHVSWSRPKNPLQRPGVYLSCPDLLLEPQPAAPAYSWSPRMHTCRREQDEEDGPPHPGRPRPLLA